MRSVATDQKSDNASWFDALKHSLKAALRIDFNIFARPGTLVGNDTWGQDSSGL